MHRALIVCLIFLSFAARAANYTVPGSFATPAIAAASTAAGDTVTVSGGPYAGFTESTDGTVGNGVTWVASGSVTITSTVTFTGDYARFIGFTVDVGFGSANGIEIDTATGVEIWHCHIRRYTNRGIYAHAGSKAIILGNTVEDQWGTAGTDAGSNDMVIFMDDSIIGYNTYFRCNEDYNYFNGQRLRWIGNSAILPNTNSAAHVDFIQTDTGNATTDILLEANFYVDSGAVQSDHHVSNLQNSGSDFTFFLTRRNVWNNIGTGTHAFFENWANVYAINDDYILAQQHSSQSSNPQGWYAAASVENPRLFNNIFVETWGSAVTAPQVYELDGSGAMANGNLAWDINGGSPSWAAPFTSQTNRVTADPSFVDYANKNFRLNGGSPAIAVGRQVTTVSSSSSTGTSFDVVDAGGLRGDNTTIDQYSGNMVVGDKITIGTDQRTITSISGNTITVDSSFTWAVGDAVFYGWGTTPDLGAFPSTSTALSAATYTQVGTTYTVTPNGDTRFVVFFVDGIPTTVVNASPYAATIASGTVTMRAYPLYANTNTSVLATTSGYTPGTYFVATNGSSGNDGLTPSTPWPQVNIETTGPSNTFYLVSGSGYTNINISYPTTTIIALTKWGPKLNNLQPGNHGIQTINSGITNCVIDGLEVAYSYIDGIKGNADSLTVRNCWIHDSGKGDPMSVTNTDGSYTGQGIAIHNHSYWLVENNLLENNGLWINHDHGTYLNGTNGICRNNVSRYNRTYGFQFYEDAGDCMNLQIYGNLWYGNKTGATLWSYAGYTNFWWNNTGIETNNTCVYLAGGVAAMTNNIFIATGGALPIDTNAATTLRSDYNLVNVGAYTSLGSHSVTNANTIAGFVSTNTGLFWLTATSPARGIAQAISLPVDFFGNASPTITDVGAFQYSAVYAADTRTLDPSSTNGANYWQILSADTGALRKVNFFPARR